MNSIHQIATDLEVLNTESSTRRWIQYTTGFDQGVNEAQQKVNAYFKNKDAFKVIIDTLERAKDSLEHREAQILYQSFKKYHQSEKVNQLIERTQVLKSSLMDVVNKFRAVIDGKEVSTTDIGKILRESPDATLRKKAYQSRIPLNKKLVDAGFIQLLDLRKELATASGSSDFVAYKLEEDELTPEIFKSWRQDCKIRREKYSAITKNLAQKYLHAENLNPWDFSYLKNILCSYNQAPADMTQFFEVTAKTFAKFNFDIRALNITFDIFPRKNKSEWGYHFTITPGHDSRILANVSNKFSEYWVLLHETAHGAHFLGLNPKEKILNKGVSGIVAEGFANFMGNQSYSHEFLSEVFTGKDIDQARKEFKELEKVSRLQEFGSISRTLFDQELYLTNIRTIDDIHNLYGSLEEDLLGSKLQGDPPWAQLIHHTSHPIYLHNYFLGDVMCENMKKVFSKKNQGRTAEELPFEFGTFWKEKVLAPSARYPFLELYENVCEEKLSIGAYLDKALETN